MCRSSYSSTEASRFLKSLNVLLFQTSRRELEDWCPHRRCRLECGPFDIARRIEDRTDLGIAPVLAAAETMQNRFLLGQLRKGDH
jgi:hypothetical protein